LTFADPNNQAQQTDTLADAASEQSASASLPPEDPAAPVDSGIDSSADASAANEDSASRRKILIGSQRDPAAYRARQKRDWTPLEEIEKKRKEKGEGRRGKQKHDQRTAKQEQHPKPIPAAAVISATSPAAAPPSAAPLPAATSPLPPTPAVTSASLADASLDLDAELSRAMGDASMDELMGGPHDEEASLEADSLQAGRVVAVRRDDVFVEFAGRQQGILSVRQFDVPPRPGAEIQVVVQRLNPEDGLYELSLPNKAVQVDDWSDLVEGALIEVRVTGHNTGGLECEVNHIRGFIPISQIALYRVEDLAPFVDQRLTCLITEADPERRNLVLSRRAILEREKEQAREQMLSSLQPGQLFDGVVRKLMDFGAFVDIGGGVDGLVHISQLAWGRVKHPSDVLHEGQTIKVRVEKVDPATGKISLGYRDLLESPWATVTQKYPPQGAVQGTVTKLMDFGAFVELEPGIEGLVHISELSHKRVWRPSDVVKEGQQVEVLVLSVDPEAQRISLSMRALAAPPEPAKKEEDATPGKPSKQRAKPTGPLLGGLGRKTGERFGLKW
jgi:predicted RNA-binding protein with RPS1 domain